MEDAPKAEGEGDKKIVHVYPLVKVRRRNRKSFQIFTPLATHLSKTRLLQSNCFVYHKLFSAERTLFRIMFDQ